MTDFTPTNAFYVEPDDAKRYARYRNDRERDPTVSYRAVPCEDCRLSFVARYRDGAYDGQVFVPQEYRG